MCLARIKLQTLKFGQPIYDSRNFRTETRLHIGKRDFCVFNSVMQQCCYKRNLVQTNLGNNSRNSDWMTDVQLTAHAGLMAMRCTRHLIRRVNQRNVSLWVTPLVSGKQRNKIFDYRRLIPSPWKNSRRRAHGERSLSALFFARTWWVAKHSRYRSSFTCDCLCSSRF